MQVITQFFGRFHPLLVHLPIGILLLAFIFEFLSYFKRYKKLRQAVQPALSWGALFAIASASSGYFLSQEGGYDDRLLALHRNTGIATAVFATILYFLRKSAVTYFQDKGKRKLIRIFLFIPLIGLLSLTGHLGGSLTHGEDYLFDFVAEGGQEASPIFKITSIENADSAVLYSDVIEPILSSRCYACHSAKKTKGQLRLDKVEFIEKGGKHGFIIEAGIPDSSELYSRLMLPLEDEHHMPPNEKPQLTSAEIAIVQSWIEEGASFKKQLGDFKQVTKIKGYLNSLLSQSNREPIIPADDVSPAPDKVIAALESRGILVIPVGAESNYLSVSFVNARSSTDKDLELLLPLRDQLLWLNLGRTKITSEGLKTIGQLTNLTHLNLDYTTVDDGGLSHLSPLSKLTSLNLVGTNVGDTGLVQLTHLKKLKKLFLYHSSITPVGLKSISGTLPDVDIDTGRYQLPKLATDTLVFTGKR